ncbi:hypothetical protein B0J11DRAFT_519776 [Dendryphion nanum]|uniref:SMP domain-containing protein n=1 Tax=Dendryphion nanum TaxID=256645 RepID=A0A9P9EF78_9PLEO|nr:hypothetical protein B0J11DRAFT_519776 [Dendryphion nanum]
MSAKLLRIGKLISPARTASPILASQFHHYIRTFTSSRKVAAIVDSDFISRITAAEKLITKQDQPVKRGPTAEAQRHAGQTLNSQILHDITTGERLITGQDSPVSGGPTSIAQQILTQGSGISGGGTGQHSGVLDGETISKIAEKEKKITGQEQPARGGPTARAQQHANEPITSAALHDITEGEKKVTGGDRVKGGPTSTVQSELAKSRS